jgi:hypothetical protein
MLLQDENWKKSLEHKKKYSYKLYFFLYSFHLIKFSKPCSVDSGGECCSSSVFSKPYTFTPSDQLVTCSRLVAHSSKAELTTVIDRALQAEPHIGSS